MTMNGPAPFNPGHIEATKLGCTCDPVKNRLGKGEPIAGKPGNTRVYIRQGCPMHSEFEPRGD